MRLDFDEWMSNFKESIVGFDYFVDYGKVYDNVERLRCELNLLNSLIGSKNIESDFDKLYDKYPEIAKALPIMIAVRLDNDNKEFTVVDEGMYKTFEYDKTYSIEEYKRFMEATGLFDMISKHIINNLYDYVTGVEVGLDSNARKNRTGKIMEAIVKSYIDETGCQYKEQLSSKKIKNEFGIDLSPMFENENSRKIFDFVVESNGHVFGIETNFYSKGGSKPNETAKSYKLLSLKSEQIKNFTFVWITDGPGWFKAKNNLVETCESCKHVYSINDLEKGYLKDLFARNI